MNAAANMEAAFTNGWYFYTLKSKHLLDAPRYDAAYPGERCVVKFFKQPSEHPGIWVRFLLVANPKQDPKDQDFVVVGAATDEYTSIYSPRRYLWFFEGLEDEALVRKHYEGRNLSGKKVKRKMMAY